MAWSFDTPGISATAYLVGEAAPLPDLIELETNRNGLALLVFKNGRTLLINQPLQVWVENHGDKS